MFVKRRERDCHTQFYDTSQKSPGEIEKYSELWTIVNDYGISSVLSMYSVTVKLTY